jgi:ligand-binding sensor domain-containing protein
MRLRFVIRVVGILLILAGPALAVDPTLFVTQYGHRAWRIRDGYFAAVPTAVTQTADGYVWIGTQAGLVRFDGARFEPWHPPAGIPLPSERIFSLLGARDGSLWIGTDSGLAEWKDGRLAVYAKTGRFVALLEDHDGTIWAGHTRNVAQLSPLCRFAKGEFRCFGPSDGLPFLWVAGLHQDDRGTLWVGGDGGVCSWTSNRAECSPIPGLEKVHDKYGVSVVSSDASGSLWVGAGARGVLQLVSGKWNHSAILPEELESESFLRDRHGSLWIGGIHQGLLRLKEGHVERYVSSDGLSGDYVTSIYEDREENLWVTTSSGLDCFRNLSVATLTKREGLSDDSIVSVMASADGSVWMGNHVNLLQVKENNFISYRPAAGKTRKQITSLLEGSRNRIWVGIDDGVSMLEGGKFVPLRVPDGTPVGVVRAMVEDREGYLWLCTTNPQHVLLRAKNGVVDQILPIASFGGEFPSTLAADPNGGLWLGFAKSGIAHFDSNGASFTVPRTLNTGRVRNFFVDDGGLWAATNEGLVFLRDGRLTSLAMGNGLPCNDIEAAIKSNDNSLWLKTACGLARIAPQEWRAWISHPQSHIQFHLYDALDGAQSGMSAFTPRAAKSTDGRLWFALEGGGIQVVDPRRLKENAVVPPVSVVQIAANRQAYDPVTPLQLPALTKDLEIDYTALSFTIPEKVRFRYKLEGTDSDWQDVGTRRQAFYTNLRPGHYRFHVTACNNDGVWNESGAALDFSILPAFFQTIWFSAICVAAIVVILCVSYLFHVKRVASEIRGRMEERLGERERIARELHDTLLQSVQGLILKFHAVAKQIPRNEPARETMEKALDRADQVLEEGRNRVRNLRDSGESIGDLSKVLQLVADESAQNSDMSYRVVVEGNKRDLHPLVLEEAYLVGREAILNAFRHSGGLHVEVEIAYDENLFRLRVRDDGRGIAPPMLESGGREGHWGLRGMRERALRIGGHLDIWSRPEAGTEVELKVPAATAYRGTRSRSAISKWSWLGRTSDMDW